MSVRHVCLVGCMLATACYGGAQAVADGLGGGAGAEEPSGEDGPQERTSDPALRCESSRMGPPLLRRMTRREFDATVRGVFPQLGDAFTGSQVGADFDSKLGFSNDASISVVSEQYAGQILATGEDVAELVTAAGMLEQVLPCAAGNPDVSCASTFAQEYGARMFRRELEPGERDEFVALFESVAERSDFKTGLHWMVVAMFQSPHLVYRFELGEPLSTGERKLRPFELATALAYGYSGAPPSDELRARAEQGALDDPQSRVEEARALMQSEAGRESVNEFFADWLDYRKVLSQTRADAPDFEAVREAMVEETKRFIETAILDDGGDIESLFLSDYTVMNAELSRFYGYGNVQGDYEVTPRPEDWAIGVLAQGSMLAGKATADSSSPTHRGLFVFEHLMCNTPPQIPENIPPAEPVELGEATTRQRFEDMHLANPACASCHTFFDPIGFGFEHFDSVGRFRADEGGLEIDATGSIAPSEITNGAEFDGLTELSQALGTAPEVKDCVSGLAAVYMFGGAGGESCLAEDARDQLNAGDIGMVEYFAQLAAAPHFSSRTLPSQ